MNISDLYLVSIPLEQGSVLRQKNNRWNIAWTLSQSLWNRAVSYDEKLVKTEMELEVSIPLEQGSVLRPEGESIDLFPKVVSIPLEQGSVLRRRLDDDYQAVKSVSIPLEQGSVLRP